MKENSNSPLRIIKNINNNLERYNFLSLLPDTDFVAKDLEESIELWLDYNNDKEYSELFFYIHDEVKDYFNTHKVIEHELKDSETNSIDNNNNMKLLNIKMNDEYYDRLLQKLMPLVAENLFLEFFPDAKEIFNEPNGKNECPDLRITFRNNKEAFIEIKSVLCSYYDDGTFKGKINNAMKGIDLILADMCLDIVKENKCNTNLRNTTIVFFFYFVNPGTKSGDFFKAFVVPAPLAIDCEFNKDGTFKKLGLKSDNNFNTVLNLKIRSPYDQFNTLYDRAVLIANSKTQGLEQIHLKSNAEGKFDQKQRDFSKFKNILQSNIDNDEKSECVDVVKNSYQTLKSYKYNTDKLATIEDKYYVKRVMMHFKELINKKYGKGTVR